MYDSSVDNFIDAKETDLINISKYSVEIILILTHELVHFLLLKYIAVIVKIGIFRTQTSK